MGGRGGHIVALTTFDALTVLIANVGELADARCLALHIRALLGDLNVSVDDPGQRHMTRGHAVHLITAIRDVHIAVRGALGNDRGGLLYGLFALSNRDALALGVLQISVLTEAAGNASQGASRRMGEMAGGRASAAARFERFEFAAFLDRREHHERLNAGLRRAGLLGHALSVGTITNVSVLASASGHADTRAQRVGVLAGSIASAALTEFLVGVFAHSRLHRDHERLGLFALFSGNADSLLIAQVSFQAEATDHAVLRA